MDEWLEAIRILLSFSFLVVSSWYDFKTREVPNKIWILFAPSGFVLSILHYLLFERSSLPIFWILSLFITVGISLAIFYLGFFGGADAKALIFSTPWREMDWQAGRINTRC